MTDVLQGLAQLERASGNLRTFFREMKRPMSTDQRNHRRAKAGPSSAWPKRATSTEARARARKRGSKRKRRLKPLLGRLPSQVRYMASRTSLRGESRVPWSGIHQDGGTAGRGSRIPARPFLWMSEEFLRLATDRIGNRLVVAYGKDGR